jgi:hypothetical protein
VKAMERLTSWWQRKPPANQKMIGIGLFVSILLLIVGLVFDSKGKPFADRHPFLVSLPKDLFRVAIVGTIGVLLIDNLRTWSRSWSELRAHGPLLQQAAGNFVVELGYQLGMGRRAELGPGISLGMAQTGCERLAGHLGPFRSYLYEQTFSPAPPEILRTEDVISIWTEATLALDEPPDGTDSDFDEITSRLIGTLERLSPFASPATREVINSTSAQLGELPAVVPQAQEALRRLFNTESINLVDRASLTGLITKCWASVEQICNVVLRVGYAYEHGREYPSRR